MGKEWNQFINYPAKRFKEEVRGRYYVLSWTPVRSIHNPNRCQVRYRRWIPGDSYPTDIPKSDVIVTKPNEVRAPVVTPVARQIETAKRYEAIKETIKVPEKLPIKRGGMGIVALVFAAILVFWFLIRGRR